jgi:cell division protein FtsI (penicillin-binding protein 3)
MKRSANDKVRLGVILVFVCLTFGIVISRLVHIQVFRSDAYSAVVDKQSSGKHAIKASRGVIYDRNGMVVASNVILNSLYAYPTNKQELKNISTYLERFFNLPQGTAIKKYRLAVNRFRWIKRKLPDNIAEKIKKDAPRGLALREEPEREYPFGTIGRQILGFTDIDNKGQSGIEFMHDSALAGQVGYVAIRRDGLQNTYRVTETPLQKPVPGGSKLLTIDWHLQEIVEEELRLGVTKYNARSGMAVFINNNNGQILAMAHYDPNEKNPLRPIKLRTVTDRFEPGSIFKIITAAGIIEDSLVNFNDSIYCENGKWKVNRRWIHDDKKHEWLNFRQIIELSSNIGIGKYAIMQGGERIYDNIEQFQVIDKQLLGWPGEARGSVFKPKKWSDHNIASLSMGHSIALTSLQLASCFSAVANGGILYKPYIILSDIDQKNNPTKIVNPIVLGEMMSQETSDSLRSFMRGVVEYGTAEPVNSPVISISGKTGTAQMINENGRGYSFRNYMASFAGFFPAEKPLITGIVVVEAPQPIHYGGHTSGPIFRKIAERYSVMNPDRFVVPDRMMAEQSDRIENVHVVPDLTGRTINQAQMYAEQKNLTVRSSSDSGIVVWQYPKAERLIFEKDEIILAVKDIDQEKLRMVNLKGLSIREASAFLELAGINFKIDGNGKVYKQSIKPGQMLTENSVCQIECRPI